ncbi:MAG: drug/metabolite exporter family protein [Chloroflexi bacterium CSP1-4]|nr:MAG: drug/metabolite exporter family protein [Chloroflexi bacterium CSP1-4]
MKYVVGVLPPVGAQLVRYAAAALVMLAYLWRREGSVGLPRRDLMMVACLGALGYGGYQMLWSTALQSTGAGESALLVAATPVMVALIAAIVGTDALDREKVLGIAVALAGVVVVVAAGRGLELDADLVGPALTLLGDLLWAVYVALAASVLRRHSSLRMTTWAALAGTAVMVPLGAVQLRDVDLGAVPMLAWVAIAFSALLSVAVGNVVTFRAVRLLGPTRVTNYQFLSPVVAVVVGALLLSEVIVPGQIVGGAIIGAGILVARGDGRRLLVRAARSVSAG